MGCGERGAVQRTDLVSQRGRVLVAKLIAVAEKTGLIVTIGAWVLAEATMELARWRDAGLAEAVWMSVNMSASQLASPTLTGSVDQSLHRANLPADLSLASSDAYRAVGRWTSASGVSLPSFVPQWQTHDSGDYDTYDCRASISGNLVSLGRFLYEGRWLDLGSLSSITRAFSFVAVGAVLMLGGFFYQRMALESKT